MSWDDGALLAWLLILTGFVIYGMTRTDEALARVRKLEEAAAEQKPGGQPQGRAVNRPESPPTGPRPRPGTVDTPGTGTEALRVSPPSPREWIDTHPTADTPTHPPAPPTAPITAQPPAEPIPAADPRPWVDEELDRWRAQQAGRTPRRHRQEDQ